MPAARRRTAARRSQPYPTAGLVGVSCDQRGGALHGPGGGHHRRALQIQGLHGYSIHVKFGLRVTFERKQGTTFPQAPRTSWTRRSTPRRPLRRKRFAMAATSKQRQVIPAADFATASKTWPPDPRRRRRSITKARTTNPPSARRSSASTVDCIMRRTSRATTWIPPSGTSFPLSAIAPRAEFCPWDLI